METQSSYCPNYMFICLILKYVKIKISLQRQILILEENVSKNNPQFLFNPSTKENKKSVFKYELSFFLNLN